jgi:aryl-alcohol dehydrogenase-like predicted oxidoreductase
MNDGNQRAETGRQPTRRMFLARLGRGAAGGVAVSLGASVGRSEAGEGGPAGTSGMVKKRPLGKTGLMVSEIGFGGHSWSYARVSDGRGGKRKPTLDETVRMISLGLEMGVNFFDSCTPEEEHTVPGEVIQRLKKREEVIVSARLCHKMKGILADRDTIERWVDQRLSLWQTAYFDILMVTNTENDTPQSGYWEMSHSVAAIEKLKKQGKIRFAGFGCHFRPEQYLDAFEKYGRSFDVCSVPYNVRHRGAESVIPAAKKAGLGMVTIKPFARGALLEGRNLGRADAGLARDMLAFVLENRDIDCSICGVHTEAHVRENFSASWTRLTPVRRRQLEQLALSTPCSGHVWLEEGWLC